MESLGSGIPPNQHGITDRNGLASCRFQIGLANGGFRQFDYLSPNYISSKSTGLLEDLPVSAKLPLIAAVRYSRAL